MKQGILLCVDDEAIVLNALRDQLRKVYGSKHIIEVAESAEEGLEILDELAGEGLLPLVIISDFLMPGMKGDAFLIEASKRFPFVITVMLSGQVEESAVQRTRDEAGLFSFFAKPWDSDELLLCIDNGLKQFAERFQEAQHGSH
ncbi:response regulator [Parachitinimonas caeni]|uniref:Response regulator n=1 Tax=Parachitinimonas caeni TaxID=3031301 RepID=A0ABT7E105_9NEIS|nr:response regulator [Parachitinimonas caeni]MDK2126005.1 response regulator [Parachitinimonas caeni]